jgi:hypothetical protein
MSITLKKSIKFEGIDQQNLQKILELSKDPDRYLLIDKGADQPAVVLSWEAFSMLLLDILNASTSSPEFGSIKKHFFDTVKNAGKLNNYVACRYDSVFLAGLNSTFES